MRVGSIMERPVSCVWVLGLILPANSDIALCRSGPQVPGLRALVPRVRGVVAMVFGPQCHSLRAVVPRPFWGVVADETLDIELGVGMCRRRFLGSVNWSRPLPRPLPSSPS